MSLDVHLQKDISQDLVNWKKRKQESLAEAGTMKGLIPLIEEYYNDRMPSQSSDELYWANITHNLTTMADKAGIYEALWRPEEISATHAKDIIPILTEGLRKLKSDPEFYKTFNATNGWGMYEHFVPFVEKYLEACIDYPDALIRVSR